MAHIILPYSMDTDEKVRRMQQDARFELTDADVPRTLDGVRRAIRSAPALPKVPKVFLTNDCVFNCAYCDCREGNDCTRRYASTPRELAEIAFKQSRNGRHGIFLTSAIIQSPNYTQELILRTQQILRDEMGYGGYLHAKVMPGADPELIRRCGRLANRLSVNIEVAHSRGYELIARNKTKKTILAPMGQIIRMIAEMKQARGCVPFATTQTTQLMAGSTGEDDFTILRLVRALYATYGLSRVYYTSFQYLHSAQGYPDLPPVHTPPWRMHRLYQADRLLQQYGFAPEEIAPPESPFLSEQFDPKAAWALRNLHLFPVEVNRAELSMLLRVPGIGHTYAGRITAARRYGILTHDGLRALGIPLARCAQFITCAGKYRGVTCENPARLAPLLADPPRQLIMDFGAVC